MLSAFAGSGAKIVRIGAKTMTFGAKIVRRYTPKPQADEALSCGELLALVEQHPMVNEQVALIAAGYVFKLLHRQPITTFVSHVDAHNMHVTSTAITPHELHTSMKPFVKSERTQ